MIIGGQYFLATYLLLAGAFILGLALATTFRWRQYAKASLHGILYAASIALLTLGSAIAGWLW